MMQEMVKIKIGHQDYYRQPATSQEDVEMVSAEQISETDRHLEQDLTGCLAKLRKLKFDLLSGIVRCASDDACRTR